MNLDLSDRVAIVTGGSRGIGRAVAEGLASAAADVVIASRNLESCELAAVEITAKTGRRSAAVPFHAGRWSDAESLADATYAEFGRCDILINNAGMSPLYPDLLSVTEDLYDKTHAVNARGPFRLSAIVGSRMAADGRGSIINVTSATALRPAIEQLPYAMAKAGLNALTLALAEAWAPVVRANLVIPGAFDTDISKGWTPEMRALAADMSPMGRMGTPGDLVGLCIFLASDAASYINGAQVLVDGGTYRTL